VETGASIQANETQLKQLPESLLRNAVEHGGDGVTNTVGGDSDEFYVEEGDPGIPESERSEVLHADYSSSEAGAGFGLSITRDIAEAHGRTIAVTGSSEGGARFEFSDIRRD
jgi:signal transduction histidine kinase